MKLKFIKRFDIFGKEIRIRFNRIDKHRTSCGGIATLLIFSMVMYQIINTIEELVLKEKPDVIFNQQYVKGVKVYNITFDEFHFALGMEDNHFQHFIDEKVYTIEAQQIKSTRDKVSNQMNYEYSNVTLERCTENSFKNPSLQEYFLRQPYQNLYCLRDDQEGLEFGGDFDLDYFSMLQLKFYKCRGANCIDSNDQKNYEQYYQYPKIAIYFNDVLTDPKDRDPFTKIGRDLYFLTSDTLQKDISVFMMENKIESQEGWLFSKEVSQQAMGFSQYQELSLITTKSDPLLFTVNIRLEKKKENKWVRKYLTISQGLSEIGGIYQALIAIGCLMLYPISQFELNRKLMNQIFSFENSSSQNENQNQNRKLIHLKTESAIHRLKDEESKSVVAGKEIRSFMSHNYLPKDVAGTFQILSQNSITYANGQKGEKSLQQFDFPNQKSPKKKTLIFNDLMNPPAKSSEESAQLSDIKKRNNIHLEVDKNYVPKPHSFDNNSLKNQQSNHSKNIQTAPNQSNQSPTQIQSQMAQQIYGIQPEKQNSQKIQTPTKLPLRQNKKKSQTLFLNQLSVSSSQFAAQRSRVYFDQAGSPTKFKQVPQPSLDESNKSPLSKQVSQVNIPAVRSVLSKKEQKEQKKREKRYKGILKDINKKFQNFFKVTANRIKINILEYVRYFICPPRQLRIKQKQMNYGMEKLYHHLDIVYILKKLTEIDKLKILLLNEQQIKLFEYLPRPKICIQENELVENQGQIQTFNFLYEDKRTEIERAKDAYESFKAITQDNYIQTKQDKKLLRMIDPHLLQLFDEQFHDQLQINLENLEELTNKDDQTDKNSKILKTKSIVSPKQHTHTGARCSIFQPDNDHNFLSNHAQSETPSSAQADPNKFREETFEESENNQSYQNNESIKENFQHNELRMQYFQKKSFSIEQPNNQTS